MMGHVNRKLNIFWIVVDSVRAFRYGQDDRDKLDVMDLFAEDSVEFTNCFTSAPSTKLAAGAMFTGMPSVYVARHFNDWKFNNDNVTTLKTLTENYNYDSIPLIDTRNGRENYQYLLPPIKTKHLPKGYKLSDYAWRNEDVNKILSHIIENNKYESPCAFTLWYDCRRDPKVNDYVTECIDLLKRKGLYNDAIIIMQSDHGYPDPSTQLNESFFRSMGHDMVLTDDNIKTPLIIKYPGAPKNKKINEIVGHIDIIPTIFDILNIPTKTNQSNYFGKSLIPLIDNKNFNRERVMRSDTRLTMDVGKITSLRNYRYKYIYFYDDNHEVLLDVENDPKELMNLLDSKKDEDIEAVLNDFRNLFKDFEIDLYNYHLQGLKDNALKNFTTLKIIPQSHSIKIGIVTKAPNRLINILVESLKNIYKDIGIVDVIAYGGANIKDIPMGKIYKTKDLTRSSISSIDLGEFDLVIFLTENSRRVFLKPEIYKAVKSINTKVLLLLNFNFEVFDYFKSRWFPNGARLYFSWSRKGFIYKEEPLTFIRDLFEFIKISFKFIFNKYQTDFVAGKEVYEYRNHQLKMGGGKLTDEILHEIKNIENWAEE